MMKINNLFTELKTGTDAYSSAYQLILKSYPSFALSFTGVSFLFILTSVLSALLPFLLKKTAEAYIVSDGFLSAFFLVTMTYAVCWTVTEVLKNIKGIFSAGVLARSDAALVSKAMEMLLSVSFKKQKDFEPAILAANIDRGSRSFSALTVSVFWTLVPVFVEISVSIFFLYQSLGFMYSMVFCLSVIGMIFLAFSIALRSQNIHSDIMNAHNSVYAYTVGRLSMPLDIRVNTAHERETTTRTKTLGHYVETIRKTNKKMGYLLSLQAAVVGALLAISVLVLVFFRNSSHIGTGDFIMIVGYISMLTFQLRTIAGACIDIQRQVVFLKKILEYTSERPEGISITNIPSESEAGYIFEVRNLGALVDHRILFNRINFTIKEGEMFALSAPSGFGKSTMLGYLLGLEAPSEGDVYFRGCRIDTGISAAVLGHISVVPQKPVLVPGTVRENILYGTDNILSRGEWGELLTSLELIPYNDDETLTIFLERYISQQGGGLSGGEIQRICIARALARKKKIIVLDEPTASISEELAIKIITYIRKRCPTVIITTHNPRILSMADHFYEGKAVES
ncbi:ATP-binding cassette domain-containing protein [Klebsiella sp. S69]|uniref:ATP-binding cassette domain-containing protein n=1 Tax=Klebsiella sp. S69 TaxID=2767439 RepID=UPI001D100991|nr:ABC transporter ATP-binding protein [Klebsiella sp. S69]